MTKKLAVCKGKLGVMMPPVREGKKPIFNQARLRLEEDWSGELKKSTILCGSVRMPVVEVSEEPHGVRRGDHTVCVATLTFEWDGQRISAEFRVAQIHTRNKHAEEAARRKQEAERLALRAAARERARTLARRTLLKRLKEAETAHDVAADIPFPHHNKLWGREGLDFAAQLGGAAAETVDVGGSTGEFLRASFSAWELSREEREDWRLRLWQACSELRSQRKALYEQRSDVKQ